MRSCPFGQVANHLCRWHHPGPLAMLPIQHYRLRFAEGSPTCAVSDRTTEPGDVKRHQNSLEMSDFRFMRLDHPLPCYCTLRFSNPFSFQKTCWVGSSSWIPIKVYTYIKSMVPINLHNWQALPITGSPLYTKSYDGRLCNVSSSALVTSSGIKSFCHWKTQKLPPRLYRRWSGTWEKNPKQIDNNLHVETSWNFTYPLLALRYYLRSIEKHVTKVHRNVDRQGWWEMPILMVPKIVLSTCALAWSQGIIFNPIFATSQKKHKCSIV